MDKIKAAKQLWKAAGHFVKKNLPTIMTIGAGVGCAVTVGLAIKATPKAIDKIEEKKKKDPDLTIWEMIAIGGPEYAAAIIAFLITEGLMFGSNHVNLKRLAGLGALYSAVCADKETKEKALKAAEELLGKEKMTEIREKVLKEEAEKPKIEEKLPKFGTGERRPCILTYQNFQIGGIFNNSYDGIDMAMTDALEEAKTYGAVKLSDVMTRLKMPDEYYIGDILVLDQDMDYCVYASTINGTPGWNVSLNTEPLIDHDAHLSKNDFSV